MSKIVLIGAFDRYNYGDNLMPMLLEAFVEKYYPEILVNNEMIFAALTHSDLTGYMVKPTVSLGDVVRTHKQDIAAIICVGGEVMGASSSTLFQHMNHPLLMRRAISSIKKFSPFLANVICQKYYGLPWEYPYVPDKKTLEPSTKIIMNTIGGGLSTRRHYLQDVGHRLESLDYLSVRDRRTEVSLSDFGAPKLYPDSVMMISDLVSDEFLESHLTEALREDATGNYLVFQASPYKSGCDSAMIVSVLEKISNTTGLDIFLCPIGYAKGHDDYDFLRDVQETSKGRFKLFYNLNVWEILWLIRKSKLFIGTSLHGVITAMSYGLPHFGLNPSVKKLQSFLETWSIEPFNRCYTADGLIGAVESLMKIQDINTSLQENSSYLKDLVEENNHNMVAALGLFN